MGRAERPDVGSAIMGPMHPETVLPGVDVLLADGSTATVRAVRPEDGPAVEALHGRLSRQSVVFRFFGIHRLSEREIGELVGADGVDRAVMVAERDAQLIGVAQYIRPAGQGEAEVAFEVDDEFQGRGIGTILLEHLAAWARPQGIQRFVADTLADNRRMLGVFRDAGFACRYERSSEVVRVVLEIGPTAEAAAAADERDRRAVVASMARLLQPGSVAVVGASRLPGTIGHELLLNLLSGGFEGPVFPVNPSAGHVGGVYCWPSVEAIPGPVDLAVVAVPAPAVADVVEACGRKGVGGLVVVSAGFAETGADGAESQRAVVHLAHSHGMRVVGPNCFGVINTDPAVAMNATFAADAPRPGRVGFASQSGGLGIAILAEATTRGLGLSSFVSMGNKADVSGNDLLTWWEQDDRTDVALLYLESFGNPRKFSRIARRFSATKPVIAVKSGRSTGGARAASSHTAALSSPDEVVDALCRRTGVVRVDSIEELFDTAEVLANQPLTAGRRVAIVGNAGGPGVLAADACASHGLATPELSPSTQQALRTFLPADAGVRNPVDMVASATPETFRRAIELILGTDEVDALLVIFTPPLVTRADEVAAAVVAAVDSAERAGEAKPVVASFLGAAEAAPRLHLARRPIPCFTYPETAVRALAHAAGYARWRQRPDEDPPVLEGIDPNRARITAGEAVGEGEGWVTGSAALAVLEAYGIPTVPSVTAADADGAAGAAGEVGYPVALKAQGPTLLHKTERGGVHLHLADESALREAFATMAGTLGDELETVVVQPMAATGVELLAGFVQDESFGPRVVVGLGGTVVELLGDHQTRMAPLSRLDAGEMLDELRGAPLLAGYRGTPTVDREAVVDLLVRLSRLADDLPELVEADCNPVIVTPTGAVVVDARFRVGPPVQRDDTRHLR